MRGVSNAAKVLMGDSARAALEHLDGSVVDLTTSNLCRLACALAPPASNDYRPDSVKLLHRRLLRLCDAALPHRDAVIADAPAGALARLSDCASV